MGSLKASFSEEKYSVEIKRDTTTGVAVYEKWYNKDGVLHRTDGPASTARDATTGVAFCEEWCKDGVLHRADGPAFIARDSESGVVLREEWYSNGQETSRPDPKTPDVVAPAPQP